MTDPTILPSNLPKPIDDGACDHLQGTFMPDIELTATNHEKINLSQLSGYTVLYLYPMTASPGNKIPDGWDEIPGARGCTPQSCSFRDHYQELQKFNASVYGLSTQTTEYQQEAKTRLHLPFELLSDAELILANTLKLPTFNVEGMQLYKRTTLILKDNVIECVFYPVFPPDRNADEVLRWLAEKS